MGLYTRRDMTRLHARRPYSEQIRLGPRGGRLPRVLLLGDLLIRLFIIVVDVGRQIGAGGPHRLHEGHAVLTQDPLHAADRIALAVEQVAHAA